MKIKGKIELEIKTNLFETNYVENGLEKVKALLESMGFAVKLDSNRSWTNKGSYKLVASVAKQT